MSVSQVAGIENGWTNFPEFFNEQSLLPPNIAHVTNLWKFIHRNLEELIQKSPRVKFWIFRWVG